VSRERKREVLRIRCTRETLVRFKRYAAHFKNYEEALKSLLNRAGEPVPDLKPYWIPWEKAERKKRV